MVRARLIWGLLRRAKADGNAKQLDDAFLAHGATLLRLDCVGDGVPDRLVGCAGRDVLAEYKNPETRGKFTEGQALFAQQWRGGTVIEVRTVEDVGRVVRYLREQSRP
jgi:hypothetical protein